VVLWRSRRLGPLLDGDALRAGDGAAPNGCRVLCHGTGQALAEIGVTLMECQERQDRSVEIIDVLGLGLLTAAGGGFLLLGVAIGGPLGFEVGSDAVDGRCRCPHAS
jgi:hypothetical protein